MKGKLVLIVITLAGTLFFWLPSKTLAFDLFNKSCTGQAASSSVCQDAAKKGKNNPIAGSNGILQEAANLVALITGIAAVIVIIISGFIFVTAGGTGFKGAAGGAPTRAAKARGALTGAVIGLAIVALAWALTTFIISRFVNT